MNIDSYMQIYCMYYFLLTGNNFKTVALLCKHYCLILKQDPYTAVVTSYQVYVSFLFLYLIFILKPLNSIESAAVRIMSSLRNPLLEPLKGQTESHRNMHMLIY